MIEKSTLQFLRSLQKNNDKSWFDANRPAYEQAKENIDQLAGEMIKSIAGFQPGVGHLLPKQCTFRINRDVRFSKNKMPYKNNMAIYINEGGKKSDKAGFYMHIQPGASFIAGGVWGPPAPVLAKVRQEIDYNLAEWKKIISAASFKKYFPEGINKNDSLVRPPKGYDEDNKAIEFLKLKSFIASTTFTDAEVTDKDFGKKATTAFKAMQPMVNFINRSMDEGGST